MTHLLGEFECKLDSKFRITLPAALKKQLPAAADNKFVINRGFERHLNLYPFNEWEIASAEINRLNLYVKKNREFSRYFFRGATEVNLDSAGRVLLPKRLLEYASITSEVTLFAYNNRIECWDTAVYNSLLDIEPEDFSDLAEDIMGNIEERYGEDTAISGVVVPILKNKR